VRADEAIAIAEHASVSGAVDILHEVASQNRGGRYTFDQLLELADAAQSHEFSDAPAIGEMYRYAWQELRGDPDTFVDEVIARSRERDLRPGDSLVNSFLEIHGRALPARAALRLLPGIHESLMRTEVAKEYLDWHPELRVAEFADLLALMQLGSHKKNSQVLDFARARSKNGELTEDERTILASLVQYDQTTEHEVLGLPLRN
jgi:hypothetical protein